MTAGSRNPHHKGLLAALAALTVLATVPAAATPRQPLKIANSQLEPLLWSDVAGWAEDDQSAAFETFLASCKPILRGTPEMRRARPMFGALHEVCGHAVIAKPKDAAEARAFFEQHFRPVRISSLTDRNGFVTGYYEPIFEGSSTASDEFSAPVRRKPTSLLKGGLMAVMADVKKGKKVRKVRKLVPFHDRAAIEDGALSSDLEICYLKHPVDAFFAQIQGSVRVKLQDGRMLRLNYDGQNGHPYSAVGRFLIERKHVAKEEMSMQRIRDWMTANPDEGKEIRRLNKSYVFFRETKLTDDQEAIGAQGISLTAWRSIAVDRNLHVYGTPFFISSQLPIDSDQPTTPFRRLMVAQDTGGAIIGPARADIYFGAGAKAGEISGRLRHPAQFTMLVPHALDPSVGQGDVPLPLSRPAVFEVVAEPAPDTTPAAKSNEATAAKPDAKSKVAAKTQDEATVKPAAKAGDKTANKKTKAAKPAAKSATPSAKAKAAPARTGAAAKPTPES